MKYWAWGQQIYLYAEGPLFSFGLQTHEAWARSLQFNSGLETYKFNSGFTDYRYNTGLDARIEAHKFISELEARRFIFVSEA